jgi:metal-responsive CopG/Arc/MetJ family transcriptional regulator
MPLHKTAVTIAEDLLAQVDQAAQQRGESRSRYISRVLRLAVGARRDAEVTRRLNALFAGEAVRREQLHVAEQLQSAGVNWEDDAW